MSTKNKSRLEIQEIIRASILDALAAFGLRGWDVCEFANASIQSGDKVILLNNIRNVRIGWQGRKYASDSNGIFGRTEEFIDEQSWQIHVIAKRKAKPSDTLAEDVANQLMTWFNGFGLEGLISKGVAPLRVDTENIIVYNDDSDLYQKRAVFTVKLQVPKEVTLNQPELEVDSIDIRRV